MKAIFRITALLAALVIAGPATASTTRIESLTLEILRKQADAQRQLEARQVPIRNRVDLYVGVMDASLRLRSLRWTIDEGAEQTRSFDGDEAASLQQSMRLLRFDRRSIGAGVRTLVVHIEAERLGTGSTPTLVSAKAEKSLDKFDGAESWILQLQADTPDKPAQLRFQRYLAQLPSPGAWFHVTEPASKSATATATVSADTARGDPALAHARHLGDLAQARGKTLAPIRELFVYAGTVERQSDEYLALAAEAYRAAGLIEIADSIASHYKGSGIGAVQMAIVRWRLADAWRQRGKPERAEALFLAARKDLPEEWMFEWRLDYSLLLLEQNRNDEALALLQQDNIMLEERRGRERAGRDRFLASLYHQFNLAVALLRTGNTQRGLGILDQLGHLDAGSDETLLALRDKANTKMGWYFLAARQGTTAASALGRVRSEGPFANVALLGMGWAQLVPSGEPLTKRRLPQAAPGPVQSGAVDAAPAGIASEALPQASVDSLFEAMPVKDPQLAAARALQAWRLLTPRDVRDPAVQESLMAVAYVYDRLGVRQSAGDAYSAAITVLEAQRRQTLADRARAAELATQLLAAKDEASLQRVLVQLRLSPDETGGGFQRRMSELRGLQALPQRLESAASAAPDARVRELAALIAAQGPAQQAEVQALVDAHLRSREQQLKTYLSAAYFALARIQDPGRYRQGLTP